jgi:hypothetical protein
MLGTWDFLLNQIKMDLMKMRLNYSHRLKEKISITHVKLWFKSQTMKNLMCFFLSNQWF